MSLTMFAAPGAVHCGKLLDVRSGRIVSDQVVIFDAGVITAVGTASNTTLPAGVKPIDLTTGTCMPGFIDVHTHITVNLNTAGIGGSAFQSHAKPRWE